MLALLYLVAGVSQLVVGIASFIGPVCLRNGILVAGALGIASCLGAFLMWGFGFMKALFMILSALSVYFGTQIPVQEPAPPTAPAT